MQFSKRVWLLRAYVGAITLAAAVLLVRAEWVIPDGGTAFWNVVAALIGLGLLAEALSLQMHLGTTSVSFVPYLASIIMVGPVWGMVVAGVTELCAEALFRRKPLIKVLHNTSKEILGVGLAAYVFIALGGSPAIDRFALTSPALVPVFVLCVVVCFLVSNGAGATAVSIQTGGDLADAWREIVWKSFAYNVFSSSISLLLAFLYIELELAGFLLVIIPVFFLRHAHSVNYRLEAANRELLQLMVKSIEARDPYTSGHSLRVARVGRALARQVGVSAKVLEQIETAALLHDVGKIYDEYAPILRKEGKLTPEERALMETHPIRSAELVATISGLRGNVVRCIRHHHENWDGGGYPDGLVGDEIPLGARIIMIADTADAMMTDRPYRNALSYERVVDEFAKYSGKQFDPALVLAFKRSHAIRRMVDGRPVPERSVAAPSAKERLRAGIA